MGHDLDDEELKVTRRMKKIDKRKFIDDVTILYDFNENEFYLIKENENGKITQKRVLHPQEINLILFIISHFETKFDWKEFCNQYRENYKDFDENHIPHID